jgi:hypothetical protein
VVDLHTQLRCDLALRLRLSRQPRVEFRLYRRSEPVSRTADHVVLASGHLDLAPHDLTRKTVPY